MDLLERIFAMVTGGKRCPICNGASMRDTLDSMTPSVATKCCDKHLNAMLSVVS